MTAFDQLVTSLVTGGMAPGEAASLIARAVLEATNGTSGGSPVDKTAERRREFDRNRKAKEREERKKLSAKSGGSPVEVRGSPVESVPAILTSLLSSDVSLGSKKRSSEPRARGARLPDDWQPSEADRQYARDRGLTDAQIDVEATKFRNYWTNRTDKQACKRMWDRAWQNWILNVRGNGNGQANPNGLQRALASFREHVGDLDRSEEGRGPPPRLLSHG